MKPLIVPPAAQRDPDAVQMLSAWAAEDGLHCVINIGMWQGHKYEESHAWGLLLADTVRHIASALEERHGKDRCVTTSAILTALQVELDHPTSETRGAFHAGHS